MAGRMKALDRAWGAPKTGVHDPANDFTSAYREHWSRLVKLCRRCLGTQAGDAEAVAQEAFARAWASFDRFAGERPFWPWVATIARRECVDHLRRHVRDERISERTRAVPAAVPSPEDLLIHAEEEQMALAAVRSLLERDRRLVALRHLNGWSCEEIALFEGLSVQAVRSALHRARRALRVAYERVADGAAAILPLGAALRRRTLAAIDVVGRSFGSRPGLYWPMSWGEATAAAVALIVIGSGTHVTQPAIGDRPITLPAAVVQAPTPAAAMPSPVARAGPLHEGARLDIPSEPGETKDEGPGVFDGLLHSEEVSPNESVFQDVYAAPDGTVFAVGQHEDGCSKVAVECWLVFRSGDGGRTWSRLTATNYLGGELLFPPAYPTDGRIFSVGIGVQLSTDGGRSFTTVAPLHGRGAMSPDFSRGDQRILVGMAPGWVYDAATQTTGPASLPPLFANPVGAHVAFSPSHGVDRSIFVAASRSIDAADGVREYTALVHKCRERVCREVLRGPGGSPLGLLEVVLSPTFERDGVVWVSTMEKLWRSTDFGESFQPVAAPIPHLIRDLVITPEYAYVALDPAWGSSGGLFRMAAGGSEWEPIALGTSLAEGTSSIVAAAGGRLVAAAHTAYRGSDRLLWSDDHGGTWHRAA